MSPRTATPSSSARYRTGGIPRRWANSAPKSSHTDPGTAATSNTLPDSLGEGRLAAGDFLRGIHPVRYRALLDGVAVLGLTAVQPLTDQSDALRLVVLVDRLYDQDVPVVLGGSGTEGLFGEAMLRGGYRKKYLRALSRLEALAEQGHVLVGRRDPC